MKFKSQAFIFHGIGRCVNSDLYLRQAKACQLVGAHALTAPQSSA